MIVPTVEPHALAMRDLLTAAGLAVGLGGAPDEVAAPYVVLYPDPGLLSGTLGDRVATLTITAQVTAVGVGPEQALQQADKARTALVGSTLTVAGRGVHPIYQDDAQPARRDDAVQPPLWVATAQYRIVSDPQ